jgi:hypothetical protein
VSDTRDWINPAAVTRLVRQQAEATARALGHDLQPWRVVDGVGVAHCNACYEVARMAPRSFRRAPLSGPALTLRCEPRPNYLRGVRVGV